MGGKHRLWDRHSIKNLAGKILVDIDIIRKVCNYIEVFFRSLTLPQECSMKSIRKFPVEEVTGEQSVEMPVGAQPLSVQVQAGQVCIWSLVDPKAKKEKRFVQIFGIGHPVVNEGAFIGTFQMSGGAPVFHVFIK